MKVGVLHGLVGRDPQVRMVWAQVFIIHQTAEKRISFPDYSTASGEMWNVNWSEGTTEPGSSGSPLYDSNHRIVGQLCCGSAACGNDANDYYGRSIGLSWSGSSSSTLSSWLDPLGTNATYLDTLNPAAAPDWCMLC